MINFSGMYRGSGRGTYPSNRGRGRYSPNKGGSSEPGPSNILIQHGNKKLIAKSCCDDITEKEELEEFRLWKQKGQDKVSPSFKKIMKETIDEKEKMVKNQEERVILLLNLSDKKWEDQPWLLCERYLIGNNYAMESYKNRFFYENILSSNGCEINHFIGSETEAEIYNFSKIIIRKVISIEEWGITPLKTKVLINKGSRIEYNYWDYIQAFDKAFLYENEKRSHTWFIKISQEVYNQTIPPWLIKWWQFYGTSEEILPQLFRELYNEWKEVIPKAPEDNIPGIIQMQFFIEFSIPWIWKFIPKTGYTQEKLFCLKRESYSRFWDTMLRENSGTKKLNCSSTIDLIQERIDYYTILYLNHDDGQSDGVRSESMDNLQDKTKEEIVQHYLALAHKALAQKAVEDDNKSQKSDTSMAISVASSSKNKFDILEDAQSPEEDMVIQMKIEDEIKKKTQVFHDLAKNFKQ